jgi:hypothetical protein
MPEMGALAYGDGPTTGVKQSIVAAEPCRETDPFGRTMTPGSVVQPL